MIQNLLIPSDFSRRAAEKSNYGRGKINLLPRKTEEPVDLMIIVLTIHCSYAAKTTNNCGPNEGRISFIVFYRHCDFIPQSG